MTAPGNLPLQQTPLTGRRNELANAQRVLLRADVRVLTLTGTGGTGKTRLALQLAADVLDCFPDGVFFVNLAPVSDPALVAHAIAQVLGVREAANRPLLDTLRDYLQEKQMLLLLDNFEQVAASAHIVAGLVSAAPALKVLVTSRESLHLYGEISFPVPPLDLPRLDPLPGLAVLSENEAVRLFVERARAVKPDFALTERNARSVAEICHRLDGLPLAIELAAARVRILPPDAMLARLSNRLRVLTGGANDLPARQHTLRNTIAWSYDLLTEAEKKLFRRLAVFVGGRTLEAVEAVCDIDGDLGVDVLDAAEALLWKNLLQESEGPEGTLRLVMLETIHEFAREKLEESGETGQFQRRHAAHFVQLAEQAEPHLRSAEQMTWMDRLEVERHNLRTALEWSLTPDGDTAHQDLGLRLAAALHRFWEVRGPLSEGRRWLDRALLVCSNSTPELLARSFTGAGTLAFRAGDYPKAMEFHGRALDLYRQIQDLPGIAFATNNLGVQAICLGDYDASVARFKEALELYRELNDKHGIAISLNNLGESARLRADYAEATTLYEEGLALRRELKDEFGTMLVLMNLAHVAEHEDNLTRACALFKEALLACQRMGDKIHVASALIGLGGLVGVRGQVERAGRLFGAAEVLLEELGASLSAVDRREYEQQLADIRAGLVDPGVFTRAWNEGRSFSLEQAIAYADATQPEPEGETQKAAMPGAWQQRPYGLTRRELDVLQLVAKGLTDPQVADHLALSVRTVETHLRSVYNKLDVATRTEAARIAFEQSLV